MIKRCARDVIKSPGDFLVEKLCALLLLEAYFNGIDKIKFNGRSMPSLEASSAIL